MKKRKKTYILIPVEFCKDEADRERDYEKSCLAGSAPRGIAADGQDRGISTTPGSLNLNAHARDSVVYPNLLEGMEVLKRCTGQKRPTLRQRPLKI